MNKSPKIYNVCIAITLVLLVVLSRVLVEHPPNFTPVIAVGLFAGVYFSSSRYLIMLPILAMLVSAYFLGFHILVLGRVREDVIPQVADLALQAEGAEWAIAAGTVGSNLVFSVRNVGYVRAAGEVVRDVVEGLGVGGGHRSMAKGIIPLKAFRKVYGGATREHVRNALYD